MTEKGYDKLDTEGLPLGIQLESTYEEKTIQLKENDILCMCIFKSKATPIYDHFAIYLGQNKIYHHAVNRYPSIEELGKFYKAKLVDVYRYCKNEG